MATLSAKQRIFVEEYLSCWNASEAARRAGYSEKTARSQASRMLTNVNIQAAIQARIAERTMSADEVLIRLAQHARGTMADFVNVEAETLNLQKAEEADMLHLIKKFSRTETEQSTRVSVELYDAQAALVQIGKVHGLFADRVEHSGTIGTFTVDIGGDDDGSASTD